MAPQAEPPAARRVGRQPPKRAGAEGGLSSSQGGEKGGSLTPFPQRMGRRDGRTGGLRPLSWVLSQLAQKKPL